MLKVYTSNSNCDDANLTDAIIDRDLQGGHIFRDLFCNDVPSLVSKLLYIHEYGCVDYIVHTRNQELIGEIKKQLNEKGISEDLIFVA